ncbi:MAG: hypothetical protein IKW76_10595 [Clostridia bacterium]|nr:hypothetical protein [Clostridia bacterium]
MMSLKTIIDIDEDDDVDEEDKLRAACASACPGKCIEKCGSDDKVNASSAATMDNRVLDALRMFF